MNIWREPPETTRAYPGLQVTDNIAAGSICPEGTGVGLWAISTAAIREPWEVVAENWELRTFTQQDFAHFIYCLLQHRGEFARLLCTLADEERRDEARGMLRMSVPWWGRPWHRAQVLTQLRRCIAALEAHG